MGFEYIELIYKYTSSIEFEGNLEHLGCCAGLRGAGDRDSSGGLRAAYPVCAADNTAGALPQRRRHRFAGGAA